MSIRILAFTITIFFSCNKGGVTYCENLDKDSVEIINDLLSTHSEIYALNVDDKVYSKLVSIHEDFNTANLLDSIELSNHFKPPPVPRIPQGNDLCKLVGIEELRAINLSDSLTNSLILSEVSFDDSKTIACIQEAMRFNIEAYSYSHLYLKVEGRWEHVAFDAFFSTIEEVREYYFKQK